jgi:hypothetical protein
MGYSLVAFFINYGLMMFGYQWRRVVDSEAMNPLNICIKWARDSAQKRFTCDNLAQISTSTIAEVFAILSPKKIILLRKISIHFGTAWAMHHVTVLPIDYTWWTSSLPYYLLVLEPIV